ncbi:MAG: non-ribosomal peptide synthetase [Solirubrobacteraceae bacterium]
MEGPSLQGLPAQIGLPRAAERRRRASGLPTAGRSAPLSSAQEPLWYLSRLAPDNPVYNEAVTIRKQGGFDVAAFRHAFNEIVRRHEIWRSTFEVVDGQPVQVVHPPALVELPLLDLSDRSRSDGEKEAAALLGQDARRPYDLEHGPMIRPRLLHLGDDDHRLSLAMHHLVFDAFSLRRVVLPELIAGYEAAIAGRESPLVDPPVQSSDYAIWERDHRERAGDSSKMDYWRRRLGDASPLELPLDHPRPAQRRFRGATCSTCIEADTTARLKALCSQTGTSLFHLVLAAFSVLLHRYSGQDDVVFATIADQRQRREFESMLGYCATPLVLRTDLSGDPSFIELLARTRRDLDDALSNLVPFDQLVRELRVERDPGTNPVYQAMVSLEPAVVAADPSWSIDQADMVWGNAVGSAKLDLSLELDEGSDGKLRGRLNYNTDLFDSATARAMVGHWHMLLQGIAAQPQSPISALPLLTEHELQRQLVEWNATGADYPQASYVHDLVAAQARANPDSVAVDFTGNRLTYGELDVRSSRIAHVLQAAGVEHGNLVGICVERTPDMIAGMLGILKAGAAYLPLDPRYPADRLSFMLEDSGATLTLTQASLRAVLPDHGTGYICLDSEDVALARHEDIPSTPVSRADDVAYVLYTSGSTGAPKGVSIRHRSVVNLLTSMAKAPGIAPTDTVLAITTTSFDMSVPELWLALINGARLMIAPTDLVTDGRQLGRLISGSGVTFMQATPATWQMLIDGAWSGSPGLVALSGGEALSGPLAERMLDRCAVLWNAYGPTETTVWSTMARIERGAPITVGRPIANTRIYILDKHSRPVPVGVSGEMFIGGDGVAVGYLNRPELTAERFVANPFVAGGRMYRTGDRARYRADGNVEFLGRLDHQVKIRGFRIEPGEVETVLVSHPSVSAAVVVAREESPGGRVLVAYIVPRAGMPTTAELRDLCRRELPEYMVPSTFVALERLPLTINGKLDRASLPAPNRWRDAYTAYTPPRSDLEAKLVRAWARTLELDRVGIHDDFFELGGHSLLAVRLLAEVEREVGLAMPVASLFDGGATVAGLSGTIEQHTKPQSNELLVTVQPFGTRPVLFFIHADEASMLTLRHFTGPLGPDQPVLGLLPERVGYRFDQRRSVEDLAATMVAALRSVQPRGPYYLAGYSMGGLFAYEVAGQLIAAGEEIGWLGLVDAGTPSLAARYVSLRQRLARQRARDFGDASRKIWEISSRTLRSMFRRLRPPRARPGHDFDWRGADKLARRYTCRGHAGPLDLFVTSDMMATTNSHSLGWEDVHHGRVEVHEVRGDHFSMVQEPNVAYLSELLASTLRTAQGERVEMAG